MDNRIDPSTRFTLRADPYKFAQVIRNLVSNALKFTEPNGTVSVIFSIERDVSLTDEFSDLEVGFDRTQRGCRPACFPTNIHAETHRLLITVEDSGIGISHVWDHLLFSAQTAH